MAGVEQQRERSRAAGDSYEQLAAGFAKAAGFRSEFAGYEKTDVLTQVGAYLSVSASTVPATAGACGSSETAAIRRLHRGQSPTAPI